MSHVSSASIDGTVIGTKPGGSSGPIAGISVALTGLDGSQIATATTADDGTYGFPNLHVGQNYIVTPSSTSYGFDPPDHQYLPLHGSVTNSTFTATALVIFGRTLQTGSAPSAIGGCLVELVDLGGTSQTTTSDDGTGRFAFTSGLTLGHSYTLQASKNGYTAVFDAQEIDSLSGSIERDLFLSDDPHESVITKWLLPIIGSTSGVAALAWAIFTYLKPQLPAGAGPAEIQAAVQNLNLGQAVDAGEAGNIIGPQAAAQVRALGNPALAEIGPEAAADLGGAARDQAAANVAQRVVNALSNPSSSSAEVVQNSAGLGSEEIPALAEAIGNSEAAPTMLEQLKVCIPALDVPAESSGQVVLGESGFVAAVEAAETGVGAVVDAAELGEMMSVVGSTAIWNGLSVELATDLIVGIVVSA